MQLTAVPASGYLFSAFSGDLTGSGNPQTVTLSAARSVTASFTLIPIVPNVTGMTQTNAVAALANAGLVAGAVTTAASPTVPAGSVISQSPLAGAQVTAGSAVDLVISTGPTLLSISVSPVNPWTVTGWTQPFTATGAYAGNPTRDITSLVTWTSSNPGAASVSPLGIATALAPGATTVTATLGSVSGAANLTVLAYSKCDTTADTFTNVSDVQRILNEVLGIALPVHDLSGHAEVNITDAQIVINAAMGMVCAAK